MKKRSLTGIAVLAFSLNSFAQTDTLYSNNKKIPCVVKEITEDAVKYSYPNEDLINSVYKNSLQKIVFKSGRVQVFTESSSLKQVSGVRDYENVTVTAIENEIKGLYKIGDVSSKAVGTTALANQERVKNRAYRKLKIQAAMMGGNIIYLTNQRTEGNKAGGYFTASSSAETNLTGVSYNNVIPNLEEFKKLQGEHKDFSSFEEYKLGGSDSDFSYKQSIRTFVVSNVRDDNGIVTLEGELEGEHKISQFRLVGFTNEYFSIFYRDKSTVYNISVKF
ncbi:hypothetical protein [Pedobacter cryoconitis]|uniref:Uncharacterized protein n=1 Tax=Pedobacter cryoconitis TaxID=188932 RepID=A0A7X0MMX6_9SPHI|nr:hypothetical protein [Pedobacter cryoconitis]MBB6502938.1 hypothetical protein [Pedobacter cryoconitis]